MHCLPVKTRLLGLSRAGADAATFGVCILRKCHASILAASGLLAGRWMHERKVLRPMAYTKVQDFRKMRATNKGLNRKLAASLRDTAWLDKKGPEEFTAREAKGLRAIRDMLTQRLFINALTQSMQDIINGKTTGKYPA
jgi:hypothetical protein